MTDHPTSDTIYESVESVRSPLILSMLDYWRSKVAGGRLPRPADIDPTEIPKLIASMVICDLEEQPFRVRYRLAGTRQVHILGNELTGRYVDELNWEEGPFVHSIFARARDTKAPVFGFYHWGFRENTPGASEFGLFPLSEDGQTVTRVIGIDEFFPRPGSPAFGGRSRL
ncbi:PAS domain-containing protein [Dongia deserti]|uniref:PAS domain-containing protein n=1 Tax=Dongia deserti TaxID=2268030 RepID=UPI000E649D0E|nr:PAS domain-containing protein [Dongia deserti]